MRDDNDYAGMTLADLRVALTENAKQLATWHSALSEARKDHARSFCEAYSSSRDKTVGGRVRDAEMASVTDLGFVQEYEGYVNFYTTIRDLIVVLIENYV